MTTRSRLVRLRNIRFPSTAEIGGFYTVTGKGFEASAQLFLRNASGTETAAADQTVTAAGIECTVPSTLTAGVYTVVVKQNGSWDLGPVRLRLRRTRCRASCCPLRSS